MQKSCSEPMAAPCYGKYYVFSSTPAPTHVDRPRKPMQMPKRSGTCLPAHSTYIRTRGAHEFYNMMWDPSVYRGNNTKGFDKPEMDRCMRKRKELDPSIKRRKFPRKPKTVGGIVRPSISVSDQSEKVGLGEMGMQTEEFLEELTVDVTKKDMCTQIEGELDSRRLDIEYVMHPCSIGKSQTCQTDLKLSFSFEDSVVPLQQELSKKIMEQSLLETTEEMELESLRIEKRKYMQVRNEELFKLKRAVDAYRDVAEDRMRALQLGRQEAETEKEAETRLSAALFSAGCMGGILPITFGLLKLDGFMSENGSKELFDKLLPWMNEDVRKEYGGRKIVSRKLLDEMLLNVASQREAETALDQFWNSSSDKRTDSQQNFSLSEDSSSLFKTKSMFFNISGQEE